MWVNQTLTYSNVDKYFNDLKNTYIQNESDKEKAIDILFSDPDLEDNVKAIVIEKIWNYIS
ncbi:hypothetical protein [Candidatus Rickettsia kedanie]|uniref:Uncharacterized protein n=1 Tax=Candidatus Rickettsia kedanie TaxID=3115352 RepID=A0ABP9TWY6_9RICK